MIDQSKHLLPPTAITEAAPLHKSQSRSCVQQTPLRMEVAFSKIMHILHGFTTTRARKHPFRCKCALQGGQGRAANPVADVRETVLAMHPLCCMTSQHVAAPRVVVTHPVCLNAMARRRALQHHCLLHASHAAVIGLYHDTTVQLGQDSSPSSCCPWP